MKVNRLDNPEVLNLIDDNKQDELILPQIEEKITCKKETYNPAVKPLFKNNIERI